MFAISFNTISFTHDLKNLKKRNKNASITALPTMQRKGSTKKGSKRGGYAILLTKVQIK
jgi:hypothetical protein